MYCSAPTPRGGKGEHIFPRALGGALTLNHVKSRCAVCPKCNNGFLSHIDKELASRSYLSTIASQELEADIWQAWDVDHRSQNLLLEAKARWASDGTLDALITYPQVVFEKSGPAYRGDYETVGRFGLENYQHVMSKAVRIAFFKHCAAMKTLHLEKVQAGLIYQGYRLAPRVFSKHSVEEIVANIEDQSFTLRYVTNEDKQHAFRAMDRLGEQSRMKGWSYSLGSHFPTIAVYFDVGDTVRALAKIGLNLIAAYCPATPVNHDTFQAAIQLVRGDLPINQSVLEAIGFVRPEGVLPIAAPGKGHSFRMLHLDGRWHIYSSFFGGRMGSYVHFPGPNLEAWSCANIVAPVRSSKWIVTKSRILQPLAVKVEYLDSTRLCPSLKLQYTRSDLKVLATPRRRSPEPG
jgi:hypothetical protein